MSCQILVPLNKISLPARDSVEKAEVIEHRFRLNRRWRPKIKNKLNANAASVENFTLSVADSL